MMQTGHTSPRTSRLFPETAYPGTRCAIQHLSAHRAIGRLGPVVWSDMVSLARQAAAANNKIGFAPDEAATERRRHACHSHLSRSLPLLCSHLSPLARSKKSLWKYRSWKNQQWISSKLTSWPGASVARPQQKRRQLCHSQLSHYSHLACSPSSPPALSKKKLFLSSLRRSWKSRPRANTKEFYWPGASCARPFAPTAFSGGASC